MFNKIKPALISFLFLTFIFGGFLVPEVQAAVDLKDQVTGQLGAGANSAGFGTAKDPRIVIALIIQFILGFVGSVFLILIIMSAYWYLTARGRTEQIEKATGTIRRAIIGIIIVILAYSITYFVAQKIEEAVTTPTGVYN